ncbi:MAG: hypothetical protein OXJ52_06000 [Oligoflexia bacterium]|nr:hypothetical protein [Oligoflexia bacterium]
MRSSILLFVVFGLVFQVKGNHDPQMNSWCIAFPKSSDCLSYQDSHTASGGDSAVGKCKSLLAKQEQLKRDWEKNYNKNVTADKNYQQSISNYKQYLKDWEQDFYKLNKIININPINQTKYEQALSQMKRNALKIKISYNTHLEFIEEHSTIIQQFKLLKTAQIKTQEELKKNNCNN